MAQPVELVVKVLADASKATTELKNVGDTAKTTGGSFSGLGGIIGGALAVGTVVAFGKEAVTAGEEAASAMAGLEQAFLNAGDGTGQAAADAAAYASELSKLIGVEDEQILAAQTQLATFSNLSSETGRASGAFDRATTAAADLAAAGFGSLESNAATLGKILQDPAEGLGKLQKLTGPLTDSQKDLITSMAEAGDVAGAQAAVLDILEGKVAGTAAATATESAKMGVAWGEVSEAVGGVLLPILGALAPLLSTIAGFLAENMDWLLPLAGAILAVAAAVKLWGIYQAILNGTMVLNPIGLVVAAIAALIAIIILVIKNWDDIVASTQKAWEAIKEAVGAAWDWIKGKFQAVYDWFVGIRDKIAVFFSGAVEWLGDAGRSLIDGRLGGMLDRILGFYGNAGRWLFDIGKKIIEGLWDGLKDMWDNVTGWIGGLGDKIADLKGPPAKDAKLLQNAGRLVMGGFQTGLAQGWGGVAGYLSSRNVALNGALGGRAGPGGASPYTLNLYPRTVDANEVAQGFRRLELQRAYQ
jgi:hypothetical protein